MHVVNRSWAGPGQLLTRIIETMGLSRDEVYIANILKCRPDMPKGTPGNRPPTPQEMQTCIGYLIEQNRNHSAARDGRAGRDRGGRIARSARRNA